MLVEEDNDQNRDSVEKLVCDILIVTKLTPAKKLRKLLDRAFELNQVTTILGEKIHGAKKWHTRKFFSTMYDFTTIILTFAIVLWLILKAGQWHYEIDSIEIAASMYLKLLYSTFNLPQDANNSLDSRLMEFWFMILYKMRSYMWNINLQNLTPLDGIVSDFCAIRNPLHDFQNLYKYDCSECISAHRVLKMKDETEPVSGFPSEFDMNPAIFPKWGRITTLSQLRIEMLKDVNIFETTSDLFTSNVDYINKIQDLTSDKVISRLENDANVHLRWLNNNRRTGHVLKIFVKIPNVIRKEFKKSFSRNDLLIDGWNSTPYKLNVDTPYFTVRTWYLQSMGSKTLLFTPSEECLTVCYPSVITLNAGDFVVFDGQRLSAYSYPEGNSTSFAVTGYVY